jgi:hypothetical protein
MRGGKVVFDVRRKHAKNACLQRSAKGVSTYFLSPNHSGLLIDKRNLLASQSNV